MPPVGEVGQELELLAAQAGDLRLEHLHGIVREDLRAHAYRDSLRAHHEDDGDLGRERDGLFMAAVVGLDELGGLGIVEDVLGKVGSATLYIARGGGFVARVEVAEVPLLVYEEFLVREDDEGGVDGLVPVGMVLHAVAHHVRDLVELAVVHLEEGVEDAALNRLEAVLYVGYRAVHDDVGRVVEKVVLEYLSDVCHVSFSPLYRSLMRFFMM